MPPGDLVSSPIDPEGASCRAPTPPNFPGNPIFAGTGNKYQREVDFIGSGLLSLVRHYNSGLKTWVHNYMMRVQVNGTTAIAIRPDGKSLVFNGSGVGAWNSNGTVVEKLTRLSPGNSSGATWRMDTAGDTAELYDANGLPLSITARGGRGVRMAYSGGALQSVTDDFGRGLAFGYDAQGRLANVSAPGGETMSYGYGANGHLAAVTYADNTTRRYLYEKGGFPYALTGLIDQNGQRFATWNYDSLGRAVSSEHAGGVAHYTLSYDPSGLSTMVTDPLGAQRLLQHQNIAGRLVFAGSSQPCADCTGDASSTSVNAIGKVTQATDFAGVASQYGYDEARQLPVTITRAVGRPEVRSRTIVWDGTFRLPTLVTEAGRSTAYTYDSLGNKLSETITDTATNQARSWQWTYNNQKLVETVTEPNGGIWRYGYDTAGNGTSVRNPLGEQTGYSYDAAGRVTSRTAPNGLVTSYSYDARGRLVLQNVGSEVSAFGYTPAGQLASATLPNGLQVMYSYDAAQRLIAASDNRGNSISYTLDAMGNRIGEQVKDANGNIALATGRVINSLNRVAAIQGAQGQTTSLGYDANGEPVSTTDPLNQTTRQTLDGLGRSTAATFADNTSAGQAWNPLDQLTQVTDPKGVQTSYQRNAFGEVMSETSPDIGTVTYQRDANGNVTATTDAKGNIANITRDALGRPIQIAYSDQTRSFNYDASGNVIRIDDTSGSTAYTRDLQGRVLSKAQVVNDNSSGPSQYPLQYSYSGGDLAAISYPSGLQVLLRRTAGRVTGIDIQPAPKAGKAQPITAFVSALAYSALGAPKSWAWRTGDSASRSFDADGRMTQSEIASYQYDAASRITGITQSLWASGPKVNGGVSQYQTSITWSAGYDSRNRLTSLARTGAASTYQYDANSNRLAAVETTGSTLDLEGQFDADNVTQNVGQATNLQATSNQLLGFSQTTTTTSGTTTSSVTSQVAYGLDANGALTSDGLRTFVYDASGRLAKAEVFNNGEGATISYWHNALGQRVFKSEPQAEQLPPKQQSLDKSFIKWLETTFGWLFPSGNAKGTLGMAYVYDEQGNLLGEYDNGSAQGRGATEYIWLPTEQGQAILVGIYKNGSFYAVHADHLGTPRLITDSSNTPVWQWPYGAFGNNKPTGMLSAITTGAQTRLKATAPILEFNLRFPGQYFDSESNLSYNYFRTYNSRQGRYSQPDPIGLTGGINRFSYVSGQPLSFTDPAGLDPFDLQFNRAAGTLWITPPGSGSAQGFPAANNAQSSSRGPWPPGTYPFERTTTHSDDGPSSQYGSNGNTIFTVPGRSNMGVHSGRDGSTDRAGRSSAQYATDGCIRTTDDATTLLRKLLRQGHTPTVVVTD